MLGSHSPALPEVPADDVSKFVHFPRLFDISLDNVSLYTQLHKNVFYPIESLFIVVDEYSTEIKTVNHLEGHWILKNSDDIEFGAATVKTSANGFKYATRIEEFFTMPITKMFADSHVQLLNELLNCITHFMPDVKIYFQYLSLSATDCKTACQLKALDNCKSISINLCEMGSDHLEDLFDYIHPDADIKIDWDSADFENAPIYAKSFKSDSDSSWFTGRHLTTLEVETLEVRYTTCTGTDVAEFVRLWLDGKKNKTKELSFSVCDYDDYFDTLTLRDTPIRPEFYKLSNGDLLDCYGGHDFIRCDGTIATLLLRAHDNDGNKRKCYFLVWPKSVDQSFA